ncbi:hypothetical protein Scel_31580 [Streptomyces cellostaticus]|nr:hypothetical protein Scel_31580 [Streptomyces cellostaticus]
MGKRECDASAGQNCGEDDTKGSRRARAGAVGAQPYRAAERAEGHPRLFGTADCAPGASH